MSASPNRIQLGPILYLILFNIFLNEIDKLKSVEITLSSWTIDCDFLILFVFILAIKIKMYANVYDSKYNLVFICKN